MRPVRIYTLPRAADADGVATTQSLASAGDLTLDGALVTDGTAYIMQTGADSDGRPYNRHGQNVTITSAGNDSGITFTVYGMTPEGKVHSETLTGGNVAAVTTSAYFSTVTRIAASGATAGNVTAGIAVTGATPVIPLDHYIGEGVALAAIVGNTMTYTVEDTQDNIWAQTWRDGWEWNPETGNWQDHDSADFQAATATAKGNYEFVPTATRAKWSAWTSGTFEFQVISPRF